MLKHPDGRGTVVPVHSGETIGAGLMSKIQKDIGTTHPIRACQIGTL